MKEQSLKQNTPTQARSGYSRITKRLNNVQKPAQISYTGKINLD